MTQDIMNKPIVLQLNGNWMPIDQKTLKEAIIAMTSDGNSPAAEALDISYDKDENGEYDFTTPAYMTPVKWEDWVNLPIRDYDFVIHSAKMEVRAPTVLIAPSYRKMPTTSTRATKFNVYERDKGICQYTGEKVSKGSGNIDHIKPVSKGGKNTWDNMVWTNADINSKKGNKSNKEAGLTLIREPLAPKPMPVSMKFRVAKHPTWKHFLIREQS
ncbi:MAG: HNH endonuclease [Candidatus Ranarchaeia archaeon]|jgi:hypothetical protein